MIPEVRGMPYREGEASMLAAERAELFQERLAEPLPPLACAVAARRLGRVAFGVVAFAGGVTILATALAQRVPPLFGARALDPITPTHALLWTLLLAPIAAVVARLFARRWLGRSVRRALAPTPDVHADIARLSERDTAAVAADVVASLEASSVAWPLTGLAVVAPLTLHLLTACAVTEHPSRVLAAFDEWIAVSALLTVPSHAALVCLARWFAYDVKRWRPKAGRTPPGGFRAWFLTSAVGMFPGAPLAMVPPVLVAVTGLAFIPASFALMRQRVVGERAMLAVLGAPE